MSNNSRIEVNTKDGFLPHIAPSFMQHYGAESLFAIASADWLTSRLAKVLESAGKLDPDAPVARVGNVRAVQALDELFRELGQHSRTAKEALLHEAMGEAKPGKLAAVIDSVYSPGTFAIWLGLFQQSQFAAARTLLQQHNGEQPN